MESLTPEVKILDEKYYLIRSCGEEICICRSEEEAKLVIDSFAETEIINLREKNKSLNVYREDLEGGNVVRVLSQRIGYFYSSAIVEEIYFDFRDLSMVRYEKN